jgi:hypothetical protein
MNVRNILEAATYPMLVAVCAGIAWLMSETHPPAEESVADVVYRCESSKGQPIELHLTAGASSNSEQSSQFECNAAGGLPPPQHP